MKKPVLLFVFAFSTFAAAGQQRLASDTTHREDTLHLTEELLIQQQQKKLDSLIKIRLEKEIGQLSAESDRRQELEERLRQIVLTDSLRDAEQKRKIRLLKQSAKGYPVTLLEDTLFLVYTRSGSLNAAERAGAISERLRRLYQDDFFSPDTLKLVQSESGYDIVYRDNMTVMAISDLDAMFFDSSPQDLGTEYLGKIKRTVLDKREANSLMNWLKRLGLVALVIAGITLVILTINRMFRILSRKIILNKERYFNGITIGKFKLFDPQAHLAFFLRVLTVLRWITILVALYLSLPLLFSIFPQTRDYTYTLLNWVIDPVKSVLKGIFSYLPNLFTILVIYLFTRYTLKGLKYLAVEIRKGNLTIRGFYRDWAHPTYNIIRFLLYAFMFVLIFPYLPGSGSPAFQGVSVFLGILFSIGSSSAIANVVAGLVITYMRPFKVGDRVKIGDVTGDVLEKTLLVTRIRTIKNEEITVPNASVLSSHTTNFTSGAESKGLIIHTTVTLGYDIPWQKVHETLKEAALRTDLILKDPPPFVLQTSLEDFYVAYQINAYTKDPAHTAAIYSDLHRNIQDCCNESGIEILSPHYAAQRDGNMSTIPENYLPANYKAPSFRISRENEREP